MREFEISISALKEGGYIVFSGAGDERVPLTAKTSLQEASSYIRDKVEECMAPEPEQECWQSGEAMPRAITSNVVPMRRGLMEKLFGRG